MSHEYRPANPIIQSWQSAAKPPGRWLGRKRRRRRLLVSGLLLLGGLLLLVGLLLLIAVGLAQADKRRKDASAPTTAPTTTAPTTAPAAAPPLVVSVPLNAGLQKFSLIYDAPGGHRRESPAFLWYPTAAEAPRFDYNGQIGLAARDAPVAAGEYPLLVFSHGFLGAADQTIFLMEELARRGYIVAAIDHADAGKNLSKSIAWPNFVDARSWDDSKYLDRKQDLSALLDYLLAQNDRAESFLHQHLAAGRIGAIGHSLGGYAVLGMAGAWPAWRDERIGAALLLSPYALPFHVNGDLSSVKVPIMLQGGTLDWGITPFLPVVYDKLRGPKHYLVLKNETHFGWTNLISLGKTTTECIQSGNAELMTTYAVAFFDRYLKGQAPALFEQSNSRLETYRFEGARD